MATSTPKDGVPGEGAGNIAGDPPAPPHVLVVDDEEAVRYVYARYLEHAGYRFTTAASGQEALRAFQACRPDLVITDYRMPGMSGVELVRQLRTLSTVPVILVSAYLFEAGALPAGVRLLSKPVGMSAFLAATAAAAPRAGR